jgi:hypothetical protein
MEPDMSSSADELPSADDEGEVIAFLSRPDSYGADAGPVERIETHASLVFLAGPYAYKLKRAVRFSYLDYSTVERREAACRAELALNRRTAPELYLEVRPLGRDASGGLALSNTTYGIAIDHSPGNQIGGTDAGAGENAIRFPSGFQRRPGAVPGHRRRHTQPSAGRSSSNAFLRSSLPA